MGSKYVPSVKDQKADNRFQKKQLTQSKFIKPAPPRPLPPSVSAPAPTPTKASPKGK